jgi:hypothetical protein
VTRKPPTETVVERNDKGELVSVELDDGLAFDVIARSRVFDVTANVVGHRKKKRGPTLKRRRDALRQCALEIILQAKEDGSLPRTVPELARMVLDKWPTEQLGRGEDSKAMEKTIRDILDPSRKEKRREKRRLKAKQNDTTAHRMYRWDGRFS